VDKVIAQTMDFREKALFHQIHPLRLTPAIAVAPLRLTVFGSTCTEKRYAKTLGWQPYDLLRAARRDA